MFETLGCELALIGRGATLRDRLFLTHVNLRLHLQAGLAARIGRALPLGRTRTQRVGLATGESVVLRSRDVAVFEVLGCGAYDVDLRALGPVRQVVDLGANVGFATLALARRLPDAAFLCVEPSRASFALLEANLRRNVPGAVAINAAVSADEAPRRLVEGLHPGITRLAAPGEEGDLVPGRPLTALLDEAGVGEVDLLKVDIQGAEAELLESLVSWAPRVRAVLMEVHEPLGLAGATELLAAHGYRSQPLPQGRLFADDMVYAVRDRVG